MNWIVSDRVISSANNLINRTEFIQEMVHAKVSPWREFSCRGAGLLKTTIKYYQCPSAKGEYVFLLLPTLI